MNTARIRATISMCDSVFESPKKELSEYMYVQLVAVQLKLTEEDAIESFKFLGVPKLLSKSV